MHFLNMKKTKNLLRKKPHSFEVHSNESACRNSGRLGMEQVIMERDGSMGTFGFAKTVICLTRSYNIVSCWLVTDLKLMLTPFLINFDVFSVVLQ